MPDQTEVFTRPTSPGADSNLGKIQAVHNLGFVQLIDYMGNDSDVVQAARVSFGASPKKVQDDRDLLRYLMRHFHETPFEMCEAKFRCKMPIFVARQWIRTRTASINEQSLRYTETPDEFYLPTLENISLQSKDNKQGRDALSENLSTEDRSKIQELLRHSQEEDYKVYQTLLRDFGVARELARTALPTALYTQWIWKIDIRNLLRFLELRLDSHAQFEIRAYAQAMAQIVSAWLPQTWEAFVDYRRDAVTLSRPEILALRSLLDSLQGGLFETVAELAKEEHGKGALPSLGKRELAEFTAKLARIQSTV
jgi:thymidylate synthase (FAD)